MVIVRVVCDFVYMYICVLAPKKQNLYVLL